jgi:hypothetical protein
MATMRFLLDEDVPEHLAHHLNATEPLLDVVYVGGPGGPVKGTLDPELLLGAEADGRAVISKDHKTMPGHVQDHRAAGRHTWGVFLLRPGFSLQDYADDIVLLWAAATAEEWQDFLGWIPL